MEYRRRRRRARMKYRNRPAGTSGGGSAGGAVIALLLIAGIIYVIASSTAGQWVAKNVMAPVVDFFTGVSDEDKDPDAAGTGGAEDPQGSLGEGGTTAIDLSAGDSKPVSAEVTFPGVTCYMLQMGVFSSRANAEAEAATLQARGAAGYIIEDTSTGEARYRVMASGYETYDSAKSVKDRLVSEGTDCTVYTLTANSAVFKVTAPKESMEGVSEGFEALSKARAGVAEAVINFDKESMSLTEGKALAQGILDALEAEMEPLASFAPDGGALSRILNAYGNIKASLETLVNGEYQSTVDFSAAMKYTYLNITDKYAALSQALAG